VLRGKHNSSAIIFQIKTLDKQNAVMLIKFKKITRLIRVTVKSDLPADLVT